VRRPTLRQGGLRRRLVLSFGATSTALIVAALLPLGFLLTHNHFTQYADQYERQARAAATAAASNPNAAADEISRRFPPGGDVEANLLDRNGQPLSLVLNPDLFPTVPVRSSEVRDALSGQPAARAAKTDAGRRLLAAVPVVRAGRVDGVVWSSAPLDPVDQLNRGTWASLGIIGAAAILFAIVVAMAVSRQIARRLESVAAGAERFAEGRFTEPIAVAGSDEVAQLGQRLNEMALRIERSMARERDFAAAASHQLRTPLTAIKLRIEELRGMLPSGDGTAAEYLSEMGEEVDRLTFLASGLLMLAASEAGAPFEDVPAGDAIDQAVSRLRPLGRQSGVEIDVVQSDRDAAVRAASGAFEEVIFNLLDNAVKFSRPGGVVQVRSSAQDGLLVVAVADRGPGLTPEEIDHVFEPFFRSRRTRGVSGSGLGLTICARLCQVCGATIALVPRPGGGTTAEVRWPLAVAGD
jgi:signal transduction histidine kinase